MRVIGGLVAMCALWNTHVARADDADLTARLAKLEAEIDQLKAADATLAATDSALATSDVDTKEPMFRIYGFIDMGLQKVFVTDDPSIPTTKTTFVLGNINLYLDFHPSPDWSSLVEVRLTNYPQGDEQSGVPAYGVPYMRADTTVPDPGNGDGYNTVQWGAIVLERAYIQWQQSQKLGIRVGQFLTPYGIWNVDHGTPTLISLYLPVAQSNQMFPQHQLGVEAFGRLDDLPSPRWFLEYHGYVSNGRTPGAVALSEQKMFGGRVVVGTLHPISMQFGVSAMHGHFLDQQRVVDFVAQTSARIDTIEYDESAVGVDASLDLGGLRIRSEGALRRKIYAPDKRDSLFLPGVFSADGNEIDVYALAAYRIPHTRFEPYVYSELYRWATPLGEEEGSVSLGLNTYFTPAIQLKLQYIASDWFGGSDAKFKLSTRESFLAAKLVMGF